MAWDYRRERLLAYKNTHVGYMTCPSCKEKKINLLNDSFLTLYETQIWLLLCTRKYGLCKDVRRYLCLTLKREISK